MYDGIYWRDDVADNDIDNPGVSSVQEHLMTLLYRIYSIDSP